MSKSKAIAKKEVIQFHGRDITVAVTNKGEHMVSLKDICGNLGITWNAQYERIKRDEALSSVIQFTRTTAKDNKSYEMLTLPLKYLNGFLFGISTSRIQDKKKRKALVQYQHDCYQVLHDYFFTGGAVNPQATDKQLDKLTTKVDSLKKRLTNTEDKMKKFKKIANKSVKQVKQLNEDHDIIVADNKELNTIIDQLETRLTRLKKRKDKKATDELKKIIKTLKKQKKFTAKKLETTKHDLALALTVIREKKQQLEEAEAEIDALDDANNRLTQMKNTKGKELRIAHNTVAELKEAVKKIELNSFQAPLDDVVDSLIEETGFKKEEERNAAMCYLIKNYILEPLHEVPFTNKYEPGHILEEFCGDQMVTKNEEGMLTVTIRGFALLNNALQQYAETYFGKK